MPTERESRNLRQGVWNHRDVIPFNGWKFDVVRYFGDEEDIVDESLAPEEQAGQFAFGSAAGQTDGQQQFSFGDDVNMTMT
jgi:hypothetical protein